MNFYCVEKGKCSQWIFSLGTQRWSFSEQSQTYFTCMVWLNERSVIVEQFNISHVRRSGSLASVVAQASRSFFFLVFEEELSFRERDRDRERRTHMRDFQRWGKEIHPVCSLPRLQNRRHEPHIYNWSASAPEIPWQGPRCCLCVCACTYSFIAVQVRAQ